MGRVCLGPPSLISGPSICPFWALMLYYYKIPKPQLFIPHIPIILSAKKDRMNEPGWFGPSFTHFRTFFWIFFGIGDLAQNGQSRGPKWVKEGPNRPGSFIQSFSAPKNMGIHGKKDEVLEFYNNKVFGPKTGILRARKWMKEGPNWPDPFIQFC